MITAREKHLEFLLGVGGCNFRVVCRLRLFGGYYFGVLIFLVDKSFGNYYKLCIL
jgi:hypothetical protein